MTTIVLVKNTTRKSSHCFCFSDKCHSKRKEQVASNRDHNNSQAISQARNLRFGIRSAAKKDQDWKPLAGIPRTSPVSVNCISLGREDFYIIFKLIESVINNSRLIGHQAMRVGVLKLGSTPGRLLCVGRLRHRSIPSTPFHVASLLTFRRWCYPQACAMH